MVLSITEAAKKVGIGRSTLYAMKKKGSISFIEKKDGTMGIDQSELARVFPDKTSMSSSSKTEKDSIGHALSLAVAEKDRAHLQEKVRFLENQLSLEQDRVTTLLEINKKNAEQLLLATRHPVSVWKRLTG